MFVISVEDEDSLIVDLNNNGSLIVEFQKQDQDSRIADINNNNDFLIADLQNQDKKILVSLLSTTLILCVIICLLMLLYFDFTQPL